MGGLVNRFRWGVTMASAETATQHDVPYSRPVVAPETGAAVERVLRSGWLTTGPECAAFEEELAAWLGVPYAVTVSSCTAAIEIALRGLRLPRDAKVLVPAITFCGAVEAVRHAGLVPVVADVEPDTGTVSPRTCAAAAREAGGVQAMLALHFAGYPADVAALADAVGLTPDQRPMLGQAGPDGFFLDCGHSGTGFKTAPAVGLAMAELILDGAATSVDIAPFAPSRFAEGRLLVGEHGEEVVWR